MIGPMKRPKVYFTLALSLKNEHLYYYLYCYPRRLFPSFHRAFGNHLRPHDCRNHAEV